MTYFQTSIKALALTLGLMLITPNEGHSQTINWGNPTPGFQNYQSDGTSNWSAGFNFDFGVFQSPFDPALNPPNLWAAEWITLDTATYNAGAGVFADSWIPQNNDYLGQQGYIFVYNNMTADETTEWFLVSNPAWVIPASGQGQSGMKLDWIVSQASSVLYGQTSTETGDGEQGGPPPGGFSLQSFTFVPEPSTTLLFGGLLSLICFRRSRD